jgi:hypothetical protein
MDEPESLDDLLSEDEMTLRFTPLGFSTGGLVMAPEAALDKLKNAIATAELVSDVPDEVRRHFARLRKLYLYGLLEYDLFTLVEDLVHLVLEAAFRWRFVSYYESRVPIVVKGEPATLLASSFDVVREAVKLHWRLDINGQPGPLPLDLTRLFAWARREGLLVGQRSRMQDEDIAKSRNHAAHPVDYTVTMPVDAGHAVSNAAEIINKLWGVDTPGGRLFPGPIARVPRAIALAPDGFSTVEFPTLLGVREDDPKYREWVYMIYLGALDECLVRVGGGGPKPSHRPGFQTTLYPCELLWGPGSRNELISQVDRFEDATLYDEVEYLDRVFVIRVVGDRPDDARSPEDFIASSETGGVWHIIRADHPLQAWCHVRDHPDPPLSDMKDGYCPACPVTELGRFTSRTDAEKCLQML